MRKENNPASPQDSGQVRFKIINGPNLNLLGTREPEHYGTWDLKTIQNYTEDKLKDLPLSLSWYQSNHEGALIDEIQALVTSPKDSSVLDHQQYQGLIINPGAFSHTSLAILDALKILTIPIVEVHLTNVHRREKERQRLLTARASTIIMGGLGKDAYFIAVYSLYQHIKSSIKGQV